MADVVELHDLLGNEIELLELAEHGGHGFVLAEDVHAADEFNYCVGVRDQAADVVVRAGTGLQVGVARRFDEGLADWLVSLFCSRRNWPLLLSWWMRLIARLDYACRLFDSSALPALRLLSY